MVRKGIEAAVHEVGALHYVNHPGHADSLLRQLQGDIGSFIKNAPDDPLLYAYAARDNYKRWVALLKDTGIWINRVLDADSPDIPSEGVH